VNRFYTLLLTLVVVSCNQQKPADIIPNDTMQKMLVDLYYAEAYSAMVNDSLHQFRTKNQDSLAHYYKEIQSHYNVSDTLFFKSVNWYKTHPEEMDSAYAKMIVHISEIETKLGKK
jgi:hypothetical protein